MRNEVGVHNPSQIQADLRLAWYTSVTKSSVNLVAGKNSKCIVNCSCGALDAHLLVTMLALVAHARAPDCAPTAASAATSASAARLALDLSETTATALGELNAELTLMCVESGKGTFCL